MTIHRRRFCLALGGFGATICQPNRPLFAAQDTQVHEQTAPGFGTTVRLLVRHRSRRLAQQAMSEAFAEVALIESLMSIYRPTSQLSLLNRNGQLPNPHPQFVEVLRAAARFSVDTDSAFDITIQPLWNLYKASADGNRFPTEQQLRDARANIGHKNVELCDDHIQLRNGAQITLNGIAQGFATDRIRRVLLDHGMQDALIDVGELAGIGTKANGEPWKVGIQHPREQDAFISMTRIGHRCLATSGDYEMTFSEDFRSHHIFDPRTGCSPTELASVSVLAPTATEADALSTALLVMGVDQGGRLLGNKHNVDAMFVRKDGRVSATRGFPRG